MKILVLSHEFPPIGGGGGRAAFDICNQLIKQDHHITVLTAHFDNLPKEETISGINILRIPSLRKESYRAKLSTMIAYVLSGLWAGYRFIRNHKPDIIHAHFAVPAGALAFILSILTNTPYILTVHLGDVPGGVPEKTGKWFKWIKPFTYPIWNRAKRVIAVSEHTRQLALANYKVNIDVIPNGADVKLLSPNEIKLNQPVRLVFAGRFVAQKNPLAIIRILSELKDLNWRCTMLGDGPLFEEVKNEIKNKNMEARFELQGWITPEEVLQWFSKSDILFMPSLSEGLPVVGVQALAKGLAIVASDIGGFKDLVDNEKNGVLINVHDQKKFEQFLRKLITDPNFLLSTRQASLEKSLSFDIAIISQKYQIIFQEVFSKF